MNISNVIIIGGGCAGLTAATYTARSMLGPLVFANDFENKGGLLMKTSIVENYPGFADGINGFDLVDQMEKQAVDCGATIVNRKIISVDLSTTPYKLVDDQSKTYFAKTIIICTGSTPNKLNLPNEGNLWAKGISSCAVCDGALYRNKKIMVVGGGDSAMEEALFLTKFSNVILVHRRSEFRASKIMINRVLSNDKITIMYNTVIDELIGTTKLTGVVCRNIATNEAQHIDIDGLFYGLGLKPNSDIFSGQLEMDSDGYIINKPNDIYHTMTSVPGVFVAGDVCDKRYRQATVACGDGCKAALDVEKFLER